MALLESTIGKGLVAVAVGGAGYTVLQSSGVITQTEEGSNKQRNVKVGGIPQGISRGLARSRGRGFGVPETNITKKSVDIEEGDTTIIRRTNVNNSSGGGGGGDDDDDDDLSGGLKKTGDNNDIIKDTDTGAVIRDASPNDSGTKKEESSPDTGEKSDGTKKEDDTGGSAPPIYSV